MFCCYSTEAAESPRQGIEGERVLLPLVGNRLCGGPVAPTLFGVQMYTTTGETSPYFADLIDSGATWVRIPVPWRNAQAVLSDPPVYRWDAADKALAGVDDGCFNIIGTHSLAPSWAADIPNGPVHEEYLDDLADYLGALAERYDGDGDQDAPGSPVVRYWELYNEPDAITTWTGWAGEPERYAAMLQLASSAIKQANPDAKVLFGGLGYDWWDDPVMPFDPDFIRNVVNAGGVDFDYMNFHSFPLSAPRWASQGPGLLQKTKAVRAEMASLGLDKPIIITETGHLAGQSAAGQRRVADALRSAVVRTRQGRRGGNADLVHAERPGELPQLYGLGDGGGSSRSATGVYGIRSRSAGIGCGSIRSATLDCGDWRL